MNNHNAHIYTSSVAKLTRRLEVYGTGDLNDINLLKLCYKYSCYSDDYDTIQKLDKIVSELQMMKNDVCMDFSNGDFFPGDGKNDVIAPPQDVTNTAPTLLDSTINLGQNDSEYTFTLLDFTLGFSDVDGHGPGAIVIKSLPSGDLLYEGDQVIVGQIIYDPTLLVYYREYAPAYTESFNFTIFDDYVEGPLESLETTVNIIVADSVNLPPVVGDNTIYSANRIETVLTLEMFTSQLAPPYNDPEADLIDAIRINEISQANQGAYYLSGTQIAEGDIITREDLIAGLFTHEGANVDEVSSDTFTFSARDEGSMIWVE